ncbi:Uncharacterised protein [Vibrio cholerae]|nr:Uncharacterised protein [Vibrio cholerae]
MNRFRDFFLPSWHHRGWGGRPFFDSPKDPRERDQQDQHAKGFMQRH